MPGLLDSLMSEDDFEKAGQVQPGAEVNPAEPSEEVFRYPKMEAELGLDGKK